LHVEDRRQGSPTLKQSILPMGRIHACAAEMAGGGFFAWSEEMFSRRMSGLAVKEPIIHTTVGNGGPGHAYRASQPRKAPCPRLG
jgi:hypothetical protein